MSRVCSSSCASQGCGHAGIVLVPRGDRIPQTRGPRPQCRAVRPYHQGHQPGEEAIVTQEQQRPDPETQPAELKRVLYTAEALVEGGRGGHGRTSDGRLEVDLSVPSAMSGDDGPGTNPEQLFAVGYAACFQSALLAIAQGRNVDASGSQIASRVGIGPRSAGGGFGLQVWLDLRAPEIPD